MKSKVATSARPPATSARPLAASAASASSTRPTSAADDLTAALPWDIAKRYSRPVPRYTSYPPAPAWKAADPSLAHAAHERAKTGKGPLSVYVHVPFCERMCLYCGCNVVVSRSYDKPTRYVTALLREIEMVAANLGGRPLAQLHFGGGTPTFLTPDDLTRIVRAIFAALPPTPSAELGIEIDPVVTRREHLTALRALGFNRLSIGVQDFGDDVQTIIDRRQSAKVSRDAFALGRELGFASINLDLMYGLPGQSRAHVERSMQAACELGPDRIAFFGYAHVPHIKPHQKQLETHGIPAPEERWETFHAARGILLREGYRPIGMDHFAKPGDELALAASDGRLNRNFQGYTVLAPMDLVGFGVTAISEVSGTFLQNGHRLTEYMEAIEAGRLATERGLLLSPDDELRRQIITDIMCNLRLDYAAIGARFGIDVTKTFAGAIAALAPLEADGLVKRTASGLAVTELGRPLVRNVALCFDAYATPADGKAAAGRFSNAI